ncbi:MAG: hypothetical protein QMD77_02685 [Patescibacteria group bacterium]|nr:hypothetical protein [Patescibacteria group bacterium]
MKKNETQNRIKEVCETSAKYALRWFYLVALVVASVYAFWIWEKYIIKADWNEERKQKYVQEQSIFSFDRESYERAVNLLKSKKERLESGEKYSGRDLFFPEGF